MSAWRTDDGDEGGCPLLPCRLFSSSLVSVMPPCCRCFRALPFHFVHRWHHRYPLHHSFPIPPHRQLISPLFPSLSLATPASRLRFLLLLLASYRYWFSLAPPPHPIVFQCNPCCVCTEYLNTLPGSRVGDLDWYITLARHSSR